MTAKENAGAGSTASEADRTVLFADDEPEVLHLYEMFFGDEFKVLTAESGTEAVDAFGPHVDIAFLDRKMPDLTGTEVIQRLRSQGFQTPVGVISALEPEGLTINYDTYFTKPVDPDAVRDAIQQRTDP